MIQDYSFIDSSDKTIRKVLKAILCNDLFIWESDIGDPLDFTDIQMFFSKIYYWTNDDFEINITNEINIENIINYFAIEFSISSHDCFTKNLYLYHNPSIEKFEIFPWDNDATFGNDWTGVYNSSYEKWYPDNAPAPAEYVHTIKQQILFQRLMEYEIWNNSFWNKVSEIFGRNQKWKTKWSRDSNSF